MTQLREMCEREACSKPMIQNDIGYTFHSAVAGDGDRGELQPFGDGSVRGNKSLNATRHQHLGVRVEQLWIVPVNHGQEEEIVLPQIFFDAADD
jgi:hypothetical protein